MLRCAALLLALCESSVADGEDHPKQRSEASEGPADGAAPGPSRSLGTAPPRKVLDVPRAISPSITQTGELWGNPRGGRRRELVYTGVLAFGGSVKLGGPAEGGTSIGAQGLWIQGKNPSPDAIGDAGIVSNVAGVATVRLFKWWLERRFAGGRIDVKLGQIPLDDDFMVLDSAQLFINSGFGTLQTEALNIRAPIYPLGALGIRVRLQPATSWEILLGGYDGDAGTEKEHPHISDLGLGVDQGATLIAEASYQKGRRGQTTRVSVGSFYHTGDVPDFGRDGVAHGLVGPYVMAERVLPRLGGGSLTAFCHGSVALPQVRAVAARYADIGLVWRGTAWGRHQDQLGVGAAVTEFGDAYVAQMRSGGSPVTSAEWAIEATYRAEVLPWVMVQPSAQWIVDPHYSRTDSLALGTRLRGEF